MTLLAEPTVAGVPVAPVVFTLLLALVHLVGGREAFVDPEQRRLFLSAAGGASVAYAFVLLLPEVSEAALLVGEQRGEALLTEQLVYLVALAGFVAFYGVEVAVANRSGSSVEEAPLVLWVHVAVFTVYSGLIGYLLFHQEVPGLANQLFYALAMALHFDVTDFGLRRHHGAAFDGLPRWVLAAGTLVGGALGVASDVAAFTLAMLFGFVAGALLLNIVKEELPDVTEGRFLAFLVGVVVYSVLLLLT